MHNPERVPITLELRAPLPLQNGEFVNAITESVTWKVKLSVERFPGTFLIVFIWVEAVYREQVSPGNTLGATGNESMKLPVHMRFRKAPHTWSYQAHLEM